MYGQIEGEEKKYHVCAIASVKRKKNIYIMYAFR